MKGLPRQPIKQGLARISPQGTYIWRDELKARCMRRMKENRKNFCQTLRESKSVSESLKNIIDEENSTDSNGCFLVDCKDEYMDLLQYLEESLQQELKRYEEEMRFEELMKYEEESLAATVENFYETDENCAAKQPIQPRALCPYCKMFQLSLSNSGNTILCSCGFNLRLQSDKIDLNAVNSALISSEDKHRISCEVLPKYSIENIDGVDLLFLTCSSCGYFSIVL